MHQKRIAPSETRTKIMPVMSEYRTSKAPFIFVTILFFVLCFFAIRFFMPPSKGSGLSKTEEALAKLKSQDEDQKDQNQKAVQSSSATQSPRETSTSPTSSRRPTEISPLDQRVEAPRVSSSNNNSASQVTTTPQPPLPQATPVSPQIAPPPQQKPLQPPVDQALPVLSADDPNLAPAPTFEAAREASRDLIIAHNQATNLGADSSALANYFANSVNFFGKKRDRNDIAKSFRNYANTWSVQRRFTISGGRQAVQVTPIDAHNFLVRVPKSYLIEDRQGKIRQDNIINQFIITHNRKTGRFEISSMSEK